MKKYIIIILLLFSINIFAQPKKNIPPPNMSTTAAPLPISDNLWVLIITGALIGSSFLIWRGKEDKED